MKSVIGKLSNISGRFWYFTTDDGEALRIHFEGDAPRPPIEKKIALSISDTPEYEDGGYSCVAEGKYWSSIKESVAGSINETDKSIALYWQHWPGHDKEREMRTAWKWAKELERFYKLYSKGRWYVEVRAFLTESSTKAEPPYYGIQDILHGDKPVDLGDFKPKYHHVASMYSNSGYCGLGNINGTRSATYRYGTSCNEHTVIHELGHNFGLHHANTPEGEYYDKTCVMGMGPRIPGLNGPHLLQLRVESDREKITVNQSTQLLMCPVEIPEHAMHENEWQHVVIEKDGQDKMYLSLRKQKGWPYDPGRLNEDVIYIHYREDGKTVLWNTMGPNNTYNPLTLKNGVQLHYHEYANETARITLDYGDGVEVEELTIPTDFPRVFAASELSEQHAGMWYNPELTGQGFDMSVKDGKMTIYWYTYNVEQSSRRYYWGTVNLGTGSEEFDLYTTHSGTFEDSTIAKVVKVGRAQIYFTGPESGVFNYNTTEHGRGSVEIEPIAFSQDPLSGLWYEKIENVKTGFSAQFFPHLNKAILYWYTYGAKESTSQLKGYETQRWFYCDGTRVGENQYTFDILEAEGGTFGIYGPPELVKVGTATLDVTGANTMEFSYKISADPSVVGERTMMLERLF